MALSRYGQILAAAILVVVAIPRCAIAGSGSWAAPASGTWSNPANWSPAVVPNGPADDATIAVAGSSYTVTLDSDIQVSSLALASPNAQLNHTAGSFTVGSLNITAGTFQMIGGTIANGMILPAGGAFRVGNNVNNRLDNATLSGNLAISSAQLRLRNGGTWSGSAGTLTTSTLSLEDSSVLAGKTLTLANALAAVEGGATLTIATDATVRGDGTFGQTRFIPGASAVVNFGTISGVSASSAVNLRVSPSVLINQGTISTTGESVIIAAGSFENQGLVHASGPNTVNINNVNGAGWTNAPSGILQVTGNLAMLELGGVWNNNGQIQVDAGRLVLGGTFTTAAIGTINRSGGTISIAGFLDNTGTTLSFDGTTGNFSLSGGTISGGTITSTGGGTLVIGTGCLTDNATWIGDLPIGGGSLLLRNGGTWTGGAVTIGGGTFSIQYDTAIESKSISMAGFSRLVVGPSTTVTLNPTSSVAGSGTIGGAGALASGSLINNGLMTGNPNGLYTNLVYVANNAIVMTDSGTVRLNAGTLINNGTLQTSGGGAMDIANIAGMGGSWANAAGGRIIVDHATASFLGEWSNSGLIALNGGTLNLGGTFTTAGIGAINRTGGTITVNGFLDNAGATLALNDTTGPYRLAGGTISGGTILASGSGTLLIGGGLAQINALINNARLVGNLDFAGRQLQLFTGGTWTGAQATVNSGSLFIQYTSTLNGKTIALSGSRFSFATLTTSADSTIRGFGTVGEGPQNRITNNGTIRADVPGQTLAVIPTTLTNNGTLAARDGGRLSVGSVSSILGLGRLDAQGLASIVSVEGGTYTINQPAGSRDFGTLRFAGAFTRSADVDCSGFVVFDYTGASPYALLRSDVISGHAGGTWLGPGINSSAAAATAGVGVGYAEASAVVSAGAIFGGVAVDSTAVLLRYTLLGDANLNGSVEIGDFARLASQFNQPGDWLFGDFNYNGSVEIGDFSLLASNFNRVVSADRPTPAIPEPVGVCVVAAGISAFTRARGARSIAPTTD